MSIWIFSSNQCDLSFLRNSFKFWYITDSLYVFLLWNSWLWLTNLYTFMCWILWTCLCWNPLICVCMVEYHNINFQFKWYYICKTLTFKNTGLPLSDRVPSFLFPLHMYRFSGQKQCPILASGHLTSRVEIKDV